MASYIAGRQWSRQSFLYVSEARGEGGVDWGYTRDRSAAKPLNINQAKAFAADCRRVGDASKVWEVGE